jgi:hypothetical protein
MRRVLLSVVGLFLVLTVGTRIADALGSPRLRCGCDDACWCKRPELTLFRWVTPKAWHEKGLSPTEKQAAEMADL